MNRRILTILQDLEAVRENLLALSDDFWLGIEHNDLEELEKGYLFKKRYNEKLIEFDSLAGELSALVQEFTEVRLNFPEATGSQNEVENARIVRELNNGTPRHLGEDFTFMRPLGFILDGQGTIGLTTWRRLYEVFCQQLALRDIERLRSLSTHRDQISSRGRRTFSNDPQLMRAPLKIEDGIYVEGNLSANDICKGIRNLLKTFDIAEERFQLFLKEDRDAESQRPSHDNRQPLKL